MRHLDSSWDNFVFVLLGMQELSPCSMALTLALNPTKHPPKDVLCCS